MKIEIYKLQLLHTEQREAIFIGFYAVQNAQLNPKHFFVAARVNLLHLRCFVQDESMLILRMMN